MYRQSWISNYSIIILSVSAYLISTGCVFDEPYPGSELNNCETSHYLRKIVDTLESALEKAITKKKNDSYTNGEAEKIWNDEVFDKAVDLVKHGLEEDAVRWECLEKHGDFPGSEGNGDEACEEGTDSWKYFDDQYHADDAFIGKTLIFGAELVIHIRETQLARIHLRCVPGYIEVEGQEPKQDNCATETLVYTKKKGYNEAGELKDGLYELAASLGSPSAWLESTKGSGEEIEFLLKKIEDVKSNGVATFLAVSCASYEAFAFNGGSTRKPDPRWAGRREKLWDSQGAIAISDAKGRFGHQAGQAAI